MSRRRFDADVASSDEVKRRAVKPGPSSRTQIRHLEHITIITINFLNLNEVYTGLKQYNRNE
jgi:hypothetical protein